MARPIKNGLDYFPFDIDFFEDEKIEAISGEFGIKGELATVKLLCAIYRNGYFIVWNDLLKMKLLKRLSGVSPELLDQIVNRLVSWGFFDKSLFHSDKVLTSNGIQKRYLEATKRRSLNEISVYAINNGVIADNNHPPTGVNDGNSTQSKGKETKLKKKKKKDDVAKPPSDYQLCVDFWLKEFHPDWDFKGQQGKAMKSILEKLGKIIKDTATIPDSFRHVCLNLPEWYKQKDLQVIDSKFNEVITEIKNKSNGTVDNNGKPISKYHN